MKTKKKLAKKTTNKQFISLYVVNECSNQSNCGNCVAGCS